MINFDRDLQIQLHDVARMLRTRFDRWARSYGLTRAQGVILVRLHRQPGLSQIEMAALCEVELKKHAANFEALVTESKDPVHEMILIYHHIQKVYSDINPVFFYDLHKSFTKASSEFDNFKKDFIYKSIYRNREEGIKQELYRNDLDINFVTQYRVAQMDLLMTKDNFNLGTMSYAKAHQMVMDIFMHGISTVKGHKLINKYKNKHEEE